MRRNGYLWTSGVNLGRSIPLPDFLLECKISAIWRCLPLILHYICWMSAIFLLPVCLTYWPRKYTTRVNPHVDNSHQVWSWYDHTLPNYSVFVCWYVTWPCDLDLWPFEVGQLSCMAGHVNNPATKSEDPVTIRSWVTSYNFSHCLPLKMRTRPLRMRRITLPVNRGSKTITFLESPTPIWRFIIQLLLGYDDNISSKSKVIAIFLLKFAKFSLPWPQGSSEQSLTHTI